MGLEGQFSLFCFQALVATEVVQIESMSNPCMQACCHIAKLASHPVALLLAMKKICLHQLKTERKQACRVPSGSIQTTIAVNHTIIANTYIYVHTYTQTERGLLHKG